LFGGQAEPLHPELHRPLGGGRQGLFAVVGPVNPQVIAPHEEVGHAASIGIRAPVGRPRRISAPHCRCIGQGVVIFGSGSPHSVAQGGV
jgi:hypothetical protein